MLIKFHASLTHFDSISQALRAITYDLNYKLIIDNQSLSEIYISWSDGILLQNTLYHALLS